MKKRRQKKKRLGQKLLLQDARLSRARSWLLGECRKCFKFLGSFITIFVDIYIDVGVYREEAENATELETDSSVSGSSTGVGLNVQGTKINRSIRTFADA